MVADESSVGLVEEGEGDGDGDGDEDREAQNHASLSEDL